MCLNHRGAQGGSGDDNQTCGNGGLKGGYRAGSKVLSCGGSGGESGILRSLASFPDHFWLLYEDEKLVSMINGMATDEEHLTDALYEHADMHSKDGAWQMIFGVATDPAEQGKGYAAALMRRVIADTKSQGKKGLVLTCKERLLSFYRQFGYRNEGVSGSEHGGAVWYEMRLTF